MLISAKRARDKIKKQKNNMKRFEYDFIAKSITEAVLHLDDSVTFSFIFYPENEKRIQAKGYKIHTNKKLNYTRVSWEEVSNDSY